MVVNNGRRWVPAHLSRAAIVAVAVTATVSLTLTGCSGGSDHKSSGASSATSKVTNQNTGGVAGPTAATTPVPAPTPGNITSEVPSGVIKTAAPVSLNATADFGGSVTGKLAKVESITATAKLPGEVAGPAVRITVEIDNGSASTIDLRLTTVNVTTSGGVPGVPITGNGTNVFTGSLAPGKSAQGIYVLSVPTANRNPITVSVSYSTSANVLLFVGSAQ